MTILVNGEKVELPKDASVVEVINTLGLKVERVAVEVNNKIIRRTDWTSTALCEGDKVEVVHFVGGGSKVLEC